MTYEMPKLPYANNGLEPVISQATIDYHYGKHLQTYVNNLNALVPGTEFEGKSVEEIVATAPDGGIFNNAGQVLNHTLYFLQFTPQPNKHEPSGKLAEAIKRDFGSFDNFKKEMNNASTTLFGSGWTWLVKKPDGSVDIVNTSNAATPLTGADKPLLTCDVWEHAYYIDYRNARVKYVDEFWNVVNWDFVVSNYA